MTEEPRSYKEWREKQLQNPDFFALSSEEQEKRKVGRLFPAERVEELLVDLDRWLNDTVRNGMIHPASAGELQMLLNYWRERK